MLNLNVERWGPAAKGTTRQLIILCHGVGANGQDVIDLAREWGPHLPDATFVAPDAPEPFGGSPCYRQWWDIGDRDPTRVAAGAEAARVPLDAFIDAELARFTLQPDACALVGFSQGAMVALYTGLRRTSAPAAIVAYSGALIAPDQLGTAYNHTPVLLVHGEADEVVLPCRSREAEQALRAGGIPVEIHLIPGVGHWIDAVGMAAGAAMLRRHLQV